MKNSWNLKFILKYYDSETIDIIECYQLMEESKDEAIGNNECKENLISLLKQKALTKCTVSKEFLKKIKK
jgi:hypothetical protein